MEDGILKLDMISLAPSNSSAKQFEGGDMIRMSQPETSDHSTRSLSDAKIKAFEEFVEEPLHTDPPAASCWTLGFFQPYFNVTTATVQARLLKSLLPVLGDGTDFFGQEKADMYGPFWLVTTLVCAVTIAANEADGTEKYKVSLLVWSAGVLYGVALGVPVCAYCVMRNKSSSQSLLNLISLYCYSYSPFIPSTLLTLLLNWQLSILTLVLSLFWSLFFLLRNGYQGTADIEPGPRAMLTMVVMVGHLGIGFFMSWYLVRAKI